jgi:hypothetical protein
MRKKWEKEGETDRETEREGERKKEHTKERERKEVRARKKKQKRDRKSMGEEENERERARERKNEIESEKEKEREEKQHDRAQRCGPQCGATPPVLVHAGPWLYRGLTATDVGRGSRRKLASWGSVKSLDSLPRCRLISVASCSYADRLKSFEDQHFISLFFKKKFNKYFLNVFFMRNSSSKKENIFALIRGRLFLSSLATSFFVRRSDKVDEKVSLPSLSFFLSLPLSFSLHFSFIKKC